MSFVFSKLCVNLRIYVVLRSLIIVFKVTSDGKCTSWGNANVSIFDPNPYKDGKFMYALSTTSVENAHVLQ